MKPNASVVRTGNPRAQERWQGHGRSRERVPWKSILAEREAVYYQTMMDDYGKHPVRVALGRAETRWCELRYTDRLWSLGYTHKWGAFPLRSLMLHQGDSKQAIWYKLTQIELGGLRVAKQSWEPRPQNPQFGYCTFEGEQLEYYETSYLKSVEKPEGPTFIELTKTNAITEGELADIKAFGAKWPELIEWIGSFSDMEACPSQKEEVRSVRSLLKQVVTQLVVIFFDSRSEN